MRINLKIVDGKGQKWYGEFELSKEAISKTQSNIKKDSPKKKDKANLSGRILYLKEEVNFFKQPKMAEEVKAKLKVDGFHYEIPPVRVALLRLVRKKKLRRISEVKDKKEVYKYVNP